ncbi:MAG: hypothetical protein KAK00_06970 [Nanoarchaeota archaeon]|nr:hypothetical protein [Nanoarchaeota archaeon]
MIAKGNLDAIVNELLPDVDVPNFSIDWILNSPNATEDSVRKVYEFLKNKGLTNDKIASNAELLSLNPETIERNYQRLSSLGLKDEKIVTLAHLLGMNPETIERNYQRLSSLGLKDEKIASQAQLLGMNPETIERNYRGHIGLLRKEYQDRASGRELLTNYPSLLGTHPQTINANVQYLHSIGMDYGKGVLLGTTTQLKRKKMAWMLRELFDYKQLSDEQKPEAIRALYNFVRENPNYLIKSISTMERTKDKIREKVTTYRL